MRTVGDAGSNDPHGFLFKCGHDGTVFVFIAVGKCDETGAETPDEFFLGGAVQFDRQDARMEVGELAEQGFFEALFIEESEVSIVGMATILQPDSATSLMAATRASPSATVGV